MGKVEHVVNSKIIDLLNDALKSEFASIHQYWLHGVTMKHQGFNKLGKIFLEESKDENSHVDLISKRILQLGGYPRFDLMDPIAIGEDIVEMMEYNLKLEDGAVIKYTHIITEVTNLYDYTTADIMTDIIRDEENHREWLKAQLRIIAEIGKAQYLAQMINDC